MLEFFSCAYVAIEYSKRFGFETFAFMLANGWGCNERLLNRARKKTELENSFGNTSIVENQYVEIWDNMVSFRIEMWLSVMSFFGMLVVGI